MDLLSLLGGCGLIVSAHCNPAPQPTKPAARWKPMVAQAASQFALPEAWVTAVMGQESGGHTTRNGKPITSKAGAMGLMQLMPHTYNDLRRQYGLGADPYAPQDNIVAGTAYLRQMYARYGYPGMFAAYNAGPGRLDAYLTRGTPLPDETIHYLAAIAPGSETVFGASQIQPPTRARMPTKDGIFVDAASSRPLFVTLSSNQF
jgi:soluble lytic murein transglycosylase-like protein